MQSPEDARYRLRLAEGFRDEARLDVGPQRWRSCADNSQLAVENAAKAVLALRGPVGRTHDPADLLRQALQGNRFSAVMRPQVERLADVAAHLGWDVHVATDYGDDVGRRTPWELFDEPAARQALALAEEALALAKQILETWPGQP